MKKHHIRVKAIIFDMDGVITNTMPDHFRAWKAIFAKAGIQMSHLDVYKREGQRGINSVKEIFALRGKEISPREAKKILQAKEKLFKKIVRRRFIAGARRFLCALHREKFRLALVTGTSRHELKIMLPLSMRGLFDVIVTGSDVKNGKPNPEPYLKTLRKLGIAADDCVVIENAPFGIASAKKAKLRCFALETSLKRPYLKKADRIFSSIKDLEGKIEFHEIENGEN